MITPCPKPSKLKKKKKKLVRPLPKLLADVQVVFNKYIRMRDFTDGCISCPNGEVQNAGHFVEQGSCSLLRFSEDNVHGQCIRCNKWKHGNLIDYRINLVKKIGEDRVKYLEEHRHEPKKWKRTELEELKERYNVK